MEKPWLIDLKKPILKDYGKFFLARNPFPSIGVPSEGPLITVDREKVIKRFQNTVSNFLQTGDSSITVLVGGYGSGKSHMLQTFKYNINYQLLSREKGVLAVYVRSPGENFRDFYTEFMDDIGRRQLTQFSVDIINEFLKENMDRVLNEGYGHLLKSEIQDKKEYDIGALLKKSPCLDLFNDIKRSYFPDISSDIIFSFLSLPHPDHSSKAWHWLLGEKLSRGDRETIGVTNSVDDEDIAYDVFKDIILLFRKMGVKYLALFVDELEKITLIDRRRRAKYQDALRHMIDEFTKNVCIYFAVSPHEWEELTEQKTALVRRLAGNWYILEEFDYDYTKELIEKYLAFARMQNYSTKIAREKFHECNPSLAPFTDESIQAIQETTRGVVSDILLLCKKSLDYLHDNPQYKAITKDLVADVVKAEKLA